METIKIPKLSKICSKDELRELLNYVLITKNDVVATDGQALVMHPVNELFSDEFIKAIPDRIFIHFNNWKLLEKPHFGVQFVNNQIEIIYSGYSVFIPYKTEDDIGKKFPDYETLFDVEEKEVNEIAINPVYLRLIESAMFRPYDIKVMKFHFKGIEKGIVIKNTMNKAKAILMPCRIFDK